MNVMPSRYLIDTPTPFTPLEEWLAFLAEIRELPQDDEGVKGAIRGTDELIDWKRGRTFF
jgi:hypothetical protein